MALFTGEDVVLYASTYKTWGHAVSY